MEKRLICMLVDVEEINEKEYLVKYGNGFKERKPKKFIDDKSLQIKDDFKFDGKAFFDNVAKESSFKLGDKTVVYTVLMKCGTELTESVSFMHKNDVNMELGIRMCKEQIIGNYFKSLKPALEIAKFGHSYVAREEEKAQEGGADA